MLFKEHVRVTDVAPPKRSSELTLPKDMVNVMALAPHLQRGVLAFLAKKNMDLMYFQQDVFFSDERKRLLIPTQWGWLGRDTTENSPQKWLTYNRSQYLGELHQGGTAVLVEDAFSYFKLKWSIKDDPRFRLIDPVCTLGTDAKDALVIELIRCSRSAIWYYDGDSAGEAGALRGSRRLRAFGIHSVSGCAPTGYDPKDCTVAAIRQHLLQHLQGGEIGFQHPGRAE